MTTLGYQNPTNPTAILDSEQLAFDPTTGLPLVREFVVPQDSVSGQTTLSLLLDAMLLCLAELKKIRVAIEVDILPGAIEDTAGEAQDSEATEVTVSTQEGIEEY